MTPELELAAQKAANSAMSIFRDAGGLNVERDDFLQEARIAVALKEHTVVHDEYRPQALWRIGRSACIDFVRKFNGTGKAAKISDRRTEEEIEDEVAGPEEWAQDPQDYAIASEVWASVCALPVRLRIIASLLALGFQANEIADFHKVTESRISQVRADMPRILRRLSKRKR